VAVLLLAVGLRSAPRQRVTADQPQDTTTTTLLTPPGAAPFHSGPLAASPLSDTPLPQIRDLVIASSADYTLTADTTKESGREVALRVSEPIATTQPQGGQPPVGTGGIAGSLTRPLMWAQGGVALTGTWRAYGVTRLEVASIVITPADGTEIRTSTLRNDALPSLRFFIVDLPDPPADADGRLNPPPRLTAYDEAGRPVLVWERCLPACPHS
jgi:hypothetical protein